VNYGPADATCQNDRSGAPAASGTTARSFLRPAHPHAGRRKGAFRRRSHLLFLLPVAIYLPFFAYPLVYNVLVSVRDYTLTSLITGVAPFVGFRNLAAVWHDPIFPVALRNTLVFTVASIVSQYVIGLAIAHYFSRPFFLSRTLRSLLILPWLVPGVVTTAAWRWMFNESNGLINQLLGDVGVHPVGWFSTPSGAFAAVTIVNIWIGTAFTVVMLHGGMQGIPADLYEAASLDGAGHWRRFWHVTLPGLRPVTGIVIILCLIGTLKQFDIVWVLTRGGPGNATQLLSSWSYQLSFGQQEFGQGAAVGDYLFSLALLAAAVYAIWSKRTAK
jgi:multiple sugar transport system permease protein